MRIIAFVLIALAALTVQADSGLNSNPITIGRCGSPNHLGTLCLAKSASGTDYLAIFTHDPLKHEGFVLLNLARTTAQGDGSILEEYEGTSAVRNPDDGGFYEQKFELSILTPSTGQNASASLFVNGRAYYKKFDFEPYFP